MKLADEITKMGKMQWNVGKMINGIEERIKSKNGEFSQYTSLHDFHQDHQTQISVSLKTLYNCLNIYKKIPEDIFESCGVVASLKLLKLPKVQRADVIDYLRKGKVDPKDIPKPNFSKIRGN